MIKRLIDNLNYTFREFLIVSSVIVLIILIAIKQSEFKSIDLYKGKQLHQGGYYIGKILKTPKNIFDSTIKTEFKNLNKVIEDNDLIKNGYPFIIYTSKTNEFIQYIAAIPVNNCDKIKQPAKYVCNYFPKQDVLTVIHKGFLQDRNKGWKILKNEIAKNEKKLLNAPFEVFWKGIEQSKDSTKWLTGLYYPIK